MTATTESPTSAPPWLRVLSEYDLFNRKGTDGPHHVRVSPLGDGLINETFLVEATPDADPDAPAGSSPQRAVLQRVSPIFGRSVHDDIEAITAHLAQKGLVTPRLVRTRRGELSVQLAADDHAPTATGTATGAATGAAAGTATGSTTGAATDASATGSIWRVLTFIPGHCYPRMNVALASPAGNLVGRFHVAVSDLQHRFHFSRPGAHVLTQHLDRLKTALADASRPDFVPKEAPVPAAFFPLAEALLRHGETLPLSDVQVATLPRRICHGDLKASNLRFDEAGHGLCLLDLDTLGLLPLPLELGDALRSWCNASPYGEDSADAHFDLSLFEAALHGYAQAAAPLLNRDEITSLVAGVERISFQLAVRFAVDVVGQSYFRFRVDPVRHPSRAAHNLLRAQGQWSLAQAIAAARRDAEAIVDRLFPAA